MDAIFIDSNGNRKNFLYQYDVGQTFVIEDFEYEKAPKVQFSIKSIKTSPSVSSSIDTNGDLHVSIPDMLLTYGENIVAYLYIDNISSGSVVETVFISVIPRKRPADYIYTEEMFVRSINGSIFIENSGIAEVATWTDDNTNGEDRSGYFVSVGYNTYSQNLTATKATSIDNVYGVSVNKAGFVSNCDENEQLNANGNLKPRYAYVCTSGFAKVIDNGACTVGKMCVPNGDGIAVNSNSTVGYKIVSRVDDKHILIFVDPSMQTVNTFKTNIDNVSSTLNSHIKNISNPHKVTKSQLGLGNVNNTSDMDKPISTAVQEAFNDVYDVIDQLTPKTHAPTHAAGGTDAITPTDIGAVAKTDFDALKNKVDNLVFSNGISITDSVTNKQYTLGMQDGKLVVILIDDSATTA